MQGRWYCGAGIISSVAIGLNQVLIVMSEITMHVLICSRVVEILVHLCTHNRASAISLIATVHMHVGQSSKFWLSSKFFAWFLQKRLEFASFNQEPCSTNTKTWSDGCKVGRSNIYRAWTFGTNLREFGRPRIVLLQAKTLKHHCFGGATRTIMLASRARADRSAIAIAIMTNHVRPCSPWPKHSTNQRVVSNRLWVTQPSLQFLITNSMTSLAVEALRRRTCNSAIGHPLWNDISHWISRLLVPRNMRA